MRGPPLPWLLACLWLAASGRADSSLQDGVRELHGRFAVRLYQTLAETENSSDLMASPVGVSLSLALLQLGARGNTLAQLEETLGFNANDAQVRSLLLGSQGDLGNSSRGLWLQQTCTLLVQSGVDLLTSFTRSAAAWGHAAIVRANFSQDNHTGSQGERAAAGVREEAWPVQAGSSSGEPSGWGEAPAPSGRRLQVALISTVAFRGVWQTQFQFSNTQNLPFTLPDGSSVKVAMMYQAAEVGFGQFRTGSDQRYTVLDLPYLGGSLSLQVVLPSERKTPLSSLESRLSARQLASWEAGLRRTKMDVFLPRFRMQRRFSLRAALPAMGVSDAFSAAAADFTGMSEDGLYVSDAFHEVRMEVTEDGTKASAATAMVLLKRSRAPVFKADRPFLFLLRHINTGSILFMGRVMNPADQAQ
ncbi:putative serpin E3 [Salarias fasciatus]|uniref:putative serpin E3 n=1 Tax=Salarias fasciatus TaxID=181472 RepID=UPI0011767316|nr:serpin E3 [Salarias fasciatus]